MRPSLDQLEVFLAVVDTGSFRAAAARLRSAQSAVSYAVGRVEAALERRLFDRTGARPLLTREGEAVAAQARVVLGEAHRLQERREDGVGPVLRRPLSIVVDIVVAPKVLVPLLLEASHRLPGLELRLRSESKFTLIELLADGTCDVGLSGSGAAVPAGLTRESLRTFPLVPVVAAGHPLARAAKVTRSVLAEHLQVVVSERHEAGRRQPLENVVEGGSRRAYLRVTDFSLKLELLRRGVGWGYLPWELAEDDLRVGLLAQLPFPRPDVGTLSLVFNSRTGPTPFGLLVRDRLAPRGRIRRTGKGVRPRLEIQGAPDAGARKKPPR